MYFLSILLHVCFIYNSIDGYVLLAANVEDFQRIAKKLGTDRFIDQLTEIANGDTFAKFTTKPKTVIRTKPEAKDRDKPITRQREPALSLRLKDDTKIDFEELVERVKQRLEKEFKDKYKSQNKEEVTTSRIRVLPQKQRIKKRIRIKNTSPVSIVTTSNYGYYDNQYNREQSIRPQIEPKEMIEEEEILYNIDTELNPTQTNYETTQNSSPMYYDNIYNDYEAQNNTTQNDMLFEKVILKEDSYIDYVTPEKEKNIFASNEKTRYKKVDNRLKITTDKTNTEDLIEYVDEVTIGSREIKARTERLWYDESNFNDTKILSDERPGTGVPTRQTYKIVTPNYYASLPTVAERYDFNEPIPEKDRERERIKYIGNPPARINRKIKLM